MLLLWIQILSIQAVSVCNFYAAFIFAACCRNRIIAGQFINVIANRAKRNVELIRKVFHCVLFATVYKGNIIKNLIMDCQSYTKYRPNETTGGIFVSWRRKEELPTGA